MRLDVVDHGRGPSRGNTSHQANRRVRVVAKRLAEYRRRLNGDAKPAAVRPSRLRPGKEGTPRFVPGNTPGNARTAHQLWVIRFLDVS
jgi:hypothetical protein